MSNISRRSFVGAAATIPFSLWFEKYGAAQAVKTRFSAYSAQGIAMLADYKTAVGKMMNQIPAGDPTSWIFQWYTHAVKTPPGKAAELNTIYPNPSANKTLAQAVWNTCQAHFAPTAVKETYFLPWHRMFVYFFERIIRKHSGNPNFTLPYWNYSAAGANHGKIPPEFRALASSLFKPNRNTHALNPAFANVNAGQPIDQFSPGILSTSILSQCNYKPTGQTIPGFNMGLDQGLHGNIHVYVGNGTNNMGTIPWAAGDPVFWMHHCNIDRLWASWNRAGRQNPTALNDPGWWNKTFQFADENGQPITLAIHDVNTIAQLGYKYDAYEPVPACPPASLSAAVEKVHAAAGAVSLSGRPAQATLAPSGAAAESVAARIKKLKPGHHVYLVLKDLKADAQPEAVYRVYLDMPPDTPEARRQSYYVGIIHFFDAAGHGEHEGSSTSEDSGKFFSFDITRIAKALAAKGKLSSTPAVTIVPSGEPSAEAKPVIGDIKLIEK